MIDPKDSGKGSDKMDMLLRKFFIKKHNLSSSERETFVHPNIVALSDYINKSLKATDMEDIKAHLACCKECRIEVEATLDAIRRFEAGNLEKVPESISFDIGSYLKKLRNKDSNKPPKK